MSGDERPRHRHPARTAGSTPPAGRMPVAA